MNWRILRGLRDGEAAKKLAETKPQPLAKKAAKQIKSGKDARGKRRGSENN